MAEIAAVSQNVVDSSEKESMGDTLEKPPMECTAVSSDDPIRSRPNLKLDIIGDIHGEAEALTRLLSTLGYTDKGGVFQHEDRIAVFVGDFIDGGYQQRAVLDVVMPMVSKGYARAVMGNHEFNALAFHTRGGAAHSWLRPRTNKNIKQHIRFLNEYIGCPDELNRVLRFFWSLPLWMEIGGVRIVHACWDQGAIDRITSLYSGASLTPELLELATNEETQEFADIELLLKGKELPLPDEKSFIDAYGVERQSIRVKWWDDTANTLDQAYIGPEVAPGMIPKTPTEGRHLIHLNRPEYPLFFGHYWMSGEPAALKANVACVDFSVARTGGKLVAYRWDGEISLDNDKFVAVER